MPVSTSEEFCGCCIHRKVCKNVDVFASFCTKAENLEKEFPENISLKIECRDFRNDFSYNAVCRDL